MFKNHLRSAWRNMWSNKGFSFLNIFGLAIGITCASLIFLWVEDELHFDHNHLKRDRLSIIKVNDEVEDGIYTHASTPGMMGPAIQADIPGIANTCRTADVASALFSFGDHAVYAGGIYADPSVFNLFTLPFIQGNGSAAFSQPYSIVLTQKAAKKFFGDDAHIMGRTVRMDNEQDYQISGIIKDLPENSSLQFEWLAPFQVYFNQDPSLRSWDNFGLSTYVELQPNTNVENINHLLKDYIARKRGAATSTVHAFLFPMNDWHLRDDFDNGKPTGGGAIVYVHLFSTIAWIILILGCINFMNLATARSEKRAREVGVRKVLGAGRGSLIGQFLADTLFMAALAAMVSVLLMLIALPIFNSLVQKNLSLGFGNPLHLLVLVGMTLVCGLIAGSYPSLYLSAFNPIMVLKGLKIKDSSAAWIRKGLVVLQFSVSIVLIIGTLVIYQQIRHVRARDLGYDKSNLIQLAAQPNVVNHFEVIRQDLLHTNMVEEAALADHETISGGNNTTAMNWPGKDPSSQIIISQRKVSQQFLKTAGMHLREGRNFETSDIVALRENWLPADSAQIFNVIITRSMADLLGDGSAVGKSLTKTTGKGELHLRVVGVIDNYIFGDMYGKPGPVVFYCLPQVTNILYVRTKPKSDPAQALAALQGVMKKDNPVFPFDYSFVDDQFNRRFTSELLISKLSRVFASLAIIISCLGLFGLAAYTAERRRKEVGIRKVLGASVAGISALLTVSFMRLVAISCLVAFPVAWWVMDRWLQSYQYRININLWIFVIAGASALMIALVTISFQAIRAAVANPAKTLKEQ